MTLAGAGALIAAVCLAAPAHADIYGAVQDPIPPTAQAFAAKHGPAVCTALDSTPTLDGVERVAHIVIKAGTHVPDDGWTYANISWWKDEGTLKHNPGWSGLDWAQYWKKDFTTYDAGQILSLSATQYCPHQIPLLLNYGHTRSPK